MAGPINHGNFANFGFTHMVLAHDAAVVVETEEVLEDVERSDSGYAKWGGGV